MRSSLPLLLILVAAPALAEPRLAWLEGRWTGTQDGVASEEVWTSPAGGALVGMHKDVKGERMVGFEFFRIAVVPGEGLTYLASPPGAPPTPFRLLELAERRVVFANEKHDFPQRILYWLDGDGALHARIEGQLAGKARAREWTWVKSAGR